MAKAWKVFWIQDGELYSAIAFGKARIKYMPGKKCTSPKWLREKGYYPLVFDTKENAEKFFLDSLAPLNCLVVEVGVGKNLPLPPCCFNMGLAQGKIDIISDIIPNPFWPEGWPEGTRMVKWVKVPEGLSLPKPGEPDYSEDLISTLDYIFGGFF